MLKKVLLVMLTIFILTGCHKPTISYSNLSNQASQEETIQVLNTAKLPKDNIARFFNLVNTYNQGASPLVGNFKEMTNKQPNYISLKDTHLQESGEITEPNSLIPTFILLKDNISTNKNITTNYNYLNYNLDLIDHNKNFTLTKNERNKFLNTFGCISVKEIKNNEISHVNQIKKTFKDRGFKVISNHQASLITLWLHSAIDNTRYAAHCGVLIETNKQLYFIEKYACFFPYQVTKFNNRQQLKEYLLSRPDLKGDVNDGVPLVFENNKYLTK